MLILKLSRFARKQFYLVLVVAFCSALIEAFTYFWILFLTERLGILEITLFEQIGAFSNISIVILTASMALLRLFLPAFQQFWLHHFYANFANNFAKLFIENNFTQNDDEHIHFITLMTTKLKPVVNSFFLGFVGLLNCVCIVSAYIITLISMEIIDFINFCYLVLFFLVIIIPLSKIVSYFSVIIRDKMNTQAKFVDNLWKNLHHIIVSKQLKNYLIQHQLNEYAIRRADQANQYLAQFFKIIVDVVLLCTLLYFIVYDTEFSSDNMLVSIITLQRVLPYFSQMQNYFVSHKSAYGIAKEYEINSTSALGVKDVLYKSKAECFKQFEIIEGFYSWKPNSVINIKNFKITRGATIGITGQSGVGKSTFIKSMLGLNTFLEGAAYINNEKALYPYLGFFKVSYLNQEGNLLMGSVLENLRSTKIAPDLDEKIRYSQLLKDLGLPFDHNFYELSVQKLSGGQQQRLRMIIAAMSDCDIVVFDEATSALDRESVEKVIKMLKSEEFSDKTCIFVSHDALVLKEMDKVYEVGANASLIERTPSQVGVAVKQENLTQDKN